MQTSGLTNAPISKLLLIYTVASSIALAIFDIKHVPAIHVSPHLFPYGQYWRILIWQVAGFSNSTEALFAAMLAYHLRVVERAWGKRKLATFLISTLPYTTILPPLLLTLLLRPLTLSKLNYLPSGPTASLFALLAQYYASIPSTFRYRISTSSSSPSSSSSSTTTTTTSTSPSEQNNHNNIDNTNNHPPTTTTTKHPLTLTLSDKSTTYLVAAQLALSQFPAMVLPAVVGWMVGLAWRADMLPGSMGGAWRVPAWVVGEKDFSPASSSASLRRRNASGWGWGWRGGATAETATGVGAGSGTERFEDLRRRLESEVAAVAAATTTTTTTTTTSSREAGGSGSASASASGSGRQRAPVRG